MKKFIKKILVKLKILKAPESYSLRDESIQILNNKAYTVNADENGVRISSDKLTIEGKSENTLWTSAAVLCSEDYHFADADQKYVVFDIGLNIAVTSLYLSQQKNIVQIYGFEPFKETFLQAEQNLLLNPELATKIQIFNFGLSDADETKQFHYNPQLPGAMSTAFDKFPQGEMEEVELKKTSEVLLPLMENRTEHYMLKMDCEGAEAQILPEMAATGILQKFKIIIMEWHGTNPDFYVNLLQQNGFIVFCSHEIVNYQGLIRAVKQ